jgi:hypothetical protein
MPSFTFTSPEGKSYTVNGPDGATPEQAFGILQQQIGSRQSASKPQAEVGAGRAALEGYLKGASGNFSDEVYGASKASGLPDVLGGFRAPVGAARLAYEYLSGQSGDASQVYDKAVAEKRDLQKRAEEQHPTAFTAGDVTGNVAGLLALPIGGAAGAATLGGRAIRGAATGAAVGGIYGAGEGTGLEDRITRGAGGALIGGAVGGVAAPAVEGVVAGAKALAAPAISAARGIMNPEAEAARRVVSALKRDSQTGSAGLTPSEMIAARAQGAPVANMDMGGETTRALGRSAANTSPEARSALDKTINDRFASQGDRATDAVQSLVRTPANAGMTREALQQAADRSRAPYYNQAFRDGANGVWDAELQNLSTSPVMQAAIKDATASISNKTATGRAMQSQAANGTPTLEFWDQVKRNLDSRYSVLSRQGDKEAAADVQAIKSALVSKLDAAVPSYATARGVAAELFKASDALDAGEKFVNSTMKNADFAKAIGKMTPEERTLFGEGFASKLIDKIGETGSRRNVINEIMKSPAARDRVRLALGPQGLEKLDAFVSREGIMDRWRGAIQGNSTTARQLIEAGLAGGAYGAYSGNWDASTIMAGALAFGARRTQFKIDQRVAQKVGEMLASDDPRVLAKGLNIVSSNGPMSKALAATEDYLSRLTGQQSGTLSAPALQLPAPSRADNDQPAIPRPPGQ